MRKGMFTKLAADNIKRNKNTYIPYMLTCIFCIAMTYMMFFITYSPNLQEAVPSAEEVRMIMHLGIIVICIFSVIFLLYSNSFLMKRRQKELGLYNILGMEKGHIGRMLRREMVFTSLISFACGILLGILGSKLAILLLFKLLHVPARFGFYVSLEGITACAAIYGTIFLLTLFKNMRRIHLNQPAELLRGSKVGEREPKAKWLIALIGFICLGSGYYIAITTESPLEAIPLFFVAVVLVMIGTYLVFTAGSIAVLKMMRWKKSFYYKTKNFTAVSGMLYRMKQNAVGLASICILSTGVLLMLSATFCLNFGIDDIMVNRYPFEVSYSVKGIDMEQAQKIREEYESSLEKNQVPAENAVSQIYLQFACLYKDGVISIEKPDYAAVSDLGYLTLMTKEEYERHYGNDTGLKDGEVLIYRDGETPRESIKFNEREFHVKEWLSEWPLYSREDKITKNSVLIVTKNDFEKLYELQKKVYADYWSTITLELGVDVKGEKAEEIHFGNLIRDELKEYIRVEQEAGGLSEDAYIMGGVRQEEAQSYYTSNGGLLFLGLFLGTLFLLGAAMIIYYKQLSEGYEDKGRFEIMQKVGMSRKEVKSSIRRQILMVFFLPLITAMIHISAAFPLIRRLLMLFGMTNTPLFMLCTAVTALIYALLYGIIYVVTAKTYYRIVERKA